MQIISPLASGNGAHVVHQMLANNIDNYRVCSYNPWLTLFPPLLYPVCRSCAPDLVHTTPDYAIFSARKNTPLVITFHNYILDLYMRPYSSALQRLHYATDLKYLTGKAISRASCITAVSHFIANLVKEDMSTDKEIRVIYNGINENHFVPRKTQGNGKFRALFSGNLSARKGAELLPEIAEHLNPNIEILYTTGLRATRKLADHPALTCVGSVPYNEMPNLYQSADLLLFPSMREGFGLAAAEAMACGLPVIASNCSSLPELVTDGKGGYLCKPGDPVAFADRINTLADSPGQCSEMAAYNRARVEKRFSLTRMVNTYKSLFEEILDKPTEQ
jgi:glycosyltransferase involved in cell wall biosynthesis